MQSKWAQNIATALAVILMLFIAVILAGFLTWIAVWVWSQV